MIPIACFFDPRTMKTVTHVVQSFTVVEAPDSNAGYALDVLPFCAGDMQRVSQIEHVVDAWELATCDHLCPECVADYNKRVEAGGAEMVKALSPGRIEQ